MEAGLYRKTLAALAVGLAGIVAQAVLSAIIGPVVIGAAVAVLAALAVHFVPNVIMGANVNEVAAAVLRTAMEIGWDHVESDADGRDEAGG